MTKVHLRSKPSTEPVEVEFKALEPRASNRFRLRKGTEEWELAVTWRSHGGGSLLWDGRQVPFFWHRRDSRVEIWMDGAVHEFQVVNRTAHRSAATETVGAQSELKAPMPGTVRGIKIQAGADLTAHQPLVILESMKMELTLSVPHAGRVIAVTCREGQLVEIGAVLLTLEPDPHGRPS